MHSLEGSAAAASATPQSAARGSVLRCIEHLSHALDLAQLAVQGPEPEIAARYILDTLDDLQPELSALRRLLPATPDNQ
jgi:hypothetical protein